MKVGEFISNHPDAGCEVTAIRFLELEDEMWLDANYIAGDYKAPQPLDTNSFGAWFPLDVILVVGERSA